MNAPPEIETPLALVTKLKVHSPDVGKHLEWLTQLMMAGIESTGALNAEIVPSASSAGSEWVLVQRFKTPEQIESWLASEEHKRVMGELTPSLDSKQVTITESVDSTWGGISLAALTRVKEGCEKAYFAYERKYQSAQARAPGYHGAYVQPPLEGTGGTWTSIIRFKSPVAMEQWLSSDERKKLVAESTQLVKSTAFRNATTSFPGWFSSESEGAEGPPNWKTALLILLGLYPSVMLVIKYFLPLVYEYPPAVDNFVGNIITVAFTTWVTMPLFIRIYRPWLFPNETTPKWVNSFSIISLIVFFVVEIAFFWRFF